MAEKNPAGAGGSAHEPKVPQQDMQGADGYRQGYDLVSQCPFLHQKVSLRLPVRRNLEAIRAGDVKKAPPERRRSCRSSLEDLRMCSPIHKNWLTALRALGGAASHPSRVFWPFGRRPPSRDGNDGPRADHAWRAPIPPPGKNNAALGYFFSGRSARAWVDNPRNENRFTTCRHYVGRF